MKQSLSPNYGVAMSTYCSGLVIASVVERIEGLRAVAVRSEQFATKNAKSKLHNFLGCAAQVKPQLLFSHQLTQLFGKITRIRFFSFRR